MRRLLKTWGNPRHIPTHLLFFARSRAGASRVGARCRFGTGHGELVWESMWEWRLVRRGTRRSCVRRHSKGEREQASRGKRSRRTELTITIGSGELLAGAVCVCVWVCLCLYGPEGGMHLVCSPCTTFYVIYHGGQNCPANIYYFMHHICHLKQPAPAA